MKTIYLEWCDAVNNLEPWLSEKEAKEWADTENWIVKQVGFLLEQNDEYVLIASKVNVYDINNPEYGGLVKIPHTWIRKLIDLSGSVTAS